MIKTHSLCTKSTNYIQNSTKWRIKQVTKSNFDETLQEFKTHLKNSDFIAICLQKTGSYASPWQKVFNFDTIDTAYLKFKRSAEHFHVLQFGLCPFSVKGSHLTAYPFNFHLFPREELRTGMPSHSFACQTSYLTSMARLGFDFNSWIYDGISYLSRAQEAVVNPLAGSRISRAHAVESSGTFSVADSVFMERIKSQVRFWRPRDAKVAKPKADPLLNALRKVLLDDNHQSRPNMDVNVCNERQIQLVLEVLKGFPDDLVPLIIPEKQGRSQGVRIVLTSSKEDKNLLEKELQDKEDELNKRFRGFREVVELISASRKPIIAHNSLDELTFIHSKFLSPLPPSFEEFKTSLGSIFPHVIDLGQLMKEINPKGSTNNIPAASSFLKSRCVTPITIDLPLEGTENEMNEGKGHGHNVLRLSHTFAKMYSVLKLNQNNLDLEKYANTFNPSTTSLPENSDEDDNVSSGSMRRLSCEDLIFLWGFRNGSSVRELRTLLSGSHEAFTDNFDIRLVDKSCAVIAINRPGLAQSFLDSMNSGGISNVGLRNWISEGLKAASYETYKRVFEISEWDYYLADCLDQVLILNDQIPKDSTRNTTPYEIWWDDGTVLNLDEV